MSVLWNNWGKNAPDNRAFIEGFSLPISRVQNRRF